LQAQKYSVQKQLRRRYQRFMSERGDYNSLLLTILRNLVSAARRRRLCWLSCLHIACLQLALQSAVRCDAPCSITAGGRSDTA
jgi:hypothetical protein